MKKVLRANHNKVPKYSKMNPKDEQKKTPKMTTLIINEPQVSDNHHK